MKIQCDVCDKDEASVFCVADEAALCATGDHRVHHANKLAGKHQRFSLHHPSPKQAPLCDVCQDKRAFLFCHQERAIFCKECDFQIHKANEHTKNHTRFFLTGVKLSSTATLYSDSKSSDNVSSIKPQDSRFKPVLVSQTNSTPPTSKSTTARSAGAAAPVPCDNLMNSSIPSPDSVPSIKPPESRFKHVLVSQANSKKNLRVLSSDVVVL
ncbi:B-box zinc finger protein 21 [Phtheirospermum japonicum]|uniref:B-box zinc finger protein 21 n=1 Tax=Phtheirospermum japonicum TaxID=374723 RepID=A0A830BQK6_9LAMI|nr:B-box zinc finger protein 21 [Phtheirospermum japonicum]